MENTLENKAKFFAQYWEQKVLLSIRGKDNDKMFGIDSITVDFSTDKYMNTCLELTPLSAITDEDAIECKKRIGWTDFLSDIGNINSFKRFIIDIDTGLESDLYRYLDVVDYLRSKGYAFRWNGLSVEELVSRGWVKLNNQ